MAKITLNAEQKRVVDRVMRGHNVFISGKAGTGKTFIVKYLVKLMEKQKNVVVTCTTGMACTLYHQSLTLHSFAGLRNSRLNMDALVLSVTSNADCLKRWCTTDLLVIDEISQCSMKTFETINILAQRARGNNLVFGGMQVVGVGDFYQLPPVRNDIDDAKYCFESHLWRDVFPHTVLLQIVYRQDATERQFLQILGQLADGNCSQETISFIKNQLSRKTLNRDDFDVPFIPHIFCNNFDASYYNMEELEKLPGEMRIYKAEDTLSDSVLRKVTVAEETLALKVGAEVMLLYNISRLLKNGTRGRITGLNEDGPTVNFYQVGIEVKVTRVTWFAYKHGSSDVIGCRTQFPLKLAWGITVHKSQGQTLKAACVHSGKEFVPGQLYVACSRVSSVQGLSIVNFNEYKLISSSSKVDNFYANCYDDVHIPTLECCTQKTLCLDRLNGQCSEIQHIPDDFEMDENELQEIDDLCRSYFNDSESEQTCSVINLETILSDTVSQMPEDVHVSGSNAFYPHAFLEQLCEEVKNTSTPLSLKIQDVIHVLQQEEYLPNVKLFTRIYWNRLFKVLHEKSRKKKNDVAVKFDVNFLTSAAMSLCRGEDSLKEFASMLRVNVKDLDVEHFWIRTELIMAVKSHIIGYLYNLKFENSDIQRQERNVWEMSKEGKGKVRYVGGWTVVKLIYSLKKYITTNITSCNARVRQEMKKRYMWINMLESLLLQSANVHESSNYKETLSVTDVKQYRNNSLVYVNDSTFEFFMELEQKRTNTLCHEKLNTLKGKLLSLGVDGVKCNCNLKQMWIKLFDNVGEDVNQNVAEVLYVKVVEKYFNMGAGQYIRDFRRDYKVMKTEAHRKRVQERKLVKERQDEKVTIESIREDSSLNKQTSHNQLCLLVTRRGDVFENTYSKKEIEVIFKGYDPCHAHVHVSGKHSIMTD